LKVLVIGAGRQGKRWLGVLSLYGNNTPIIIDPAVEIQGYDCYPSIFEAAHIKPDCVIVSSPPSDHFSSASYYLERSCPVLLEKPLIMDYQKLRELQNIAHSNRTMLFGGYTLRHHPAYPIVTKYRRSGLIKHISMIRMVNNPPKEEGPYWHLASHDIDIALAMGLNRNQILNDIDFAFAYSRKRKTEIRVSYWDSSELVWEPPYLTRVRTDGTKNVTLYESANPMLEEFKAFVDLISAPHRYPYYHRDIQIEYITDQMNRKYGSNL